MTALTVNGVWKYYGDYPALRDISFEVQPGECVALLGRNGAGKTTLLKILAGLSRAAKGEVRVFGKDVMDRGSRSSFGILGHGIAIYDELSAFENLKLFAGLYGLSDSTARANAWLERVQLIRVKDSLVREFSRGMRQRLAVARAFIHSPRLLLFDEPFTSLDDKAVALLQSLLAESLRGGATVLMSTHQIREAMELATHTVLIQKGRLIHSGPRAPEMLSDPTWIYRTYGEE
jgi:heme ABC exporter ATP-binding subunit CcmA